MWHLNNGHEIISLMNFARLNDRIVIGDLISVVFPVFVTILAVVFCRGSDAALAHFFGMDYTKNLAYLAQIALVGSRPESSFYVRLFLCSLIFVCYFFRGKKIHFHVSIFIIGWALCAVGFALISLYESTAVSK